MSGPGAITPKSGTQALISIDGLEDTPKAEQSDIVPGNSSGGAASVATELPVLPLPKVGGLSLESLVQALGMEERATAVKNGVASIEAKAAERKEATAKRLEEINKNIETMKSQETAKTVFKVFKIVGAALGVIVGGATIVAGAVTGNPLLIAGGVCLTIAAGSSLASALSDEKYSITNGVSWVAQKFGASENVAKIIGISVEVSITVAGILLSLGGITSLAAKGAEGATNAAAAALKVVDAAGKPVQYAGSGFAFTTEKFVLALVPKIAAAISGATAVASAAGGMVNAYYDYKITTSQADQKELAAILERIQQAIDMDTDFLKELMERANELAAQTSELVQENAKAQTAILSGGTPTMA